MIHNSSFTLHTSEEATDQIREILIHENYLSQKDIEICLGFDIESLASRPEDKTIRELHELARREEQKSSVMERITAVLLNQLSGIFQDRSRLILLIAATNVPWKIDEAFLRPGRLDECLYVGPPDESACLELLRLYLRDRPMAVDLLDESTLRRLGALLLGYSGADIESTMQPLRHTATAGSLKQRCR